MVHDTVEDRDEPVDIENADNSADAVIYPIGPESGPTFAQLARVIVGGIVAVLLTALFFDTRSYVERISSYPYDASAVQITQVYAERIFYAISGVGIGIMLYVLTRYAD